MRKISRAEEQHSILNFRSATSDKCRTPSCWNKPDGTSSHCKECAEKIANPSTRSHEATKTATDDEKGHYKYIHKDGKDWVVVQKGTGKILSRHKTEDDAIASFKAMMMNKHGGVETTALRGGPNRSKQHYYELPENITQVPDSEKIKECGRCGIDMAKYPGQKLTFNPVFKSVCPDCKDVLSARD